MRAMADGKFELTISACQTVLSFLRHTELPDVPQYLGTLHLVGMFKRDGQPRSQARSMCQELRANCGCGKALSTLTQNQTTKIMARVCPMKTPP